MKTYLITGGAGFIGSHLAERLLREGNRVLSIDNLSTGSIGNIECLKEQYPIRFRHFSGAIEGDKSTVAELVDASDAIYHLAATVGVRLVAKEPTRTLTTNLDCTQIVLNEAAKKGKTFVLASTSEVYGKGAENGGLLREDGDLVLGPSTKPRWSYAVSKLCDEHLALAFHTEKQVPVIIVRLFNTVGERQTGKYGMVLPRFVQAALRGEPIRVHGDGKQTRCFCYVGDVVDALVRLPLVKDTNGQIYNIGSQNEVSILQLAGLVRERTKSNSPIEFVSYEQEFGKDFDDMRRRKPDVSKIEKAIGWRATTPLEVIIDKVAAHEARWLE